MKEKEFFKLQARDAFERLVSVENESRAKDRQHQAEHSELRYQLSQIERKSQTLWDELEAQKALNQALESTNKRLAEEMLLKEADHTEMQSQVLKVKSELVDKQAQIEELFATLTEKGEETAELSRKLIMLKNHILDQSLFEETFRIVRVPSVESLLAPNQSPLSGLKGSQRKLSLSTTMILSFIRDMQIPGEFFVRIETTPDFVPAEVKLVPALHVKQILADTLTFTVILHEDCKENDYDLVEEKTVSRSQYLNPMNLIRKKPG